MIAAAHWYRPVERVTGGSARWLIGADPDSAAKESYVPQTAAIVEVVKRWGSFAVLVIQVGRNVIEHYEEPAGPTFVSIPGPWHRALLELVLGAAIDLGAIRSLDESVVRYIPEWRDEARAKITLRDLLYNQSRLRDPPYEIAADSPGMQLFIGTDFESLLLAQQPRAAPGTCFRGAALDAKWLGSILDPTTGQSHAKQISTDLWQRIGAQDACVRLDRPRGTTRTFCCISANARDWARVGQLTFTNKRIGERQVVRAAWVQQLLTPSQLNAAVGGYWFLQAIPSISRAVVTTLTTRAATHCTSRRTGAGRSAWATMRSRSTGRLTRSSTPSMICTSRRRCRHGDFSAPST